MTSDPQLASAGGQFGVVLNDLAHEADFPFDLGGWTVDRATTSEINIFRHQLVALNEIASYHHGLPHEATIEVDPGGRAASYSWDLPPDKWRYTVVRLDGGDPDERHKLDQALRVSPADLRITGWVEWQSAAAEKSIGLNAPEWVHWLRRMFGERAPQSLDFVRVKEIFDVRQALDEDRYPNIVRALQLFVQYDELRETSGAKFLGHFAVLESLLSHNPDKHDPVDSITRQLKRNLVLLDHRMPPSENLGLTEFGKKGQQVTAEQVIGKLYSIRSSVAHGGDPSGDLAWLNDRRPSSWTPLSDHEYGYLRRVTQRVLVAALREPQLVTDLRGVA
ncbi:hypothetical protein OHB12_23635 [Nocardia sp. NBC_01730]|uniref:hypothetical protein n=1 Tax=Nocardia sp. NBC_01730 TaxID=2975998 RepID=UPI002E0EF54D|nr:hypothetical protein OHB12_23635 [Nocardia sp. NBC_01730]